MICAALKHRFPVELGPKVHSAGQEEILQVQRVRSRVAQQQRVSQGARTGWD